MGSHYTGSKKELQALNTYIKFVRAAESLNSKINLALNEFGLTESQFSVLDTLLHLGSLKQKEIGKKILKSGGNITMVIDNLEKQNLVKRKRGEKDRRHFIIHLTKRGKRKIAEVLPEIVKIIMGHFEVLNSKEQKELARLCKIVGLQVRSDIKT